MNTLIKSSLFLGLLFAGIALVQAAPPADVRPAEKQGLDSQIQDLKREVLQLNRDLFLLEEDLLFPSNTQFSVFVSLDSGKLFSLESIQVRIDDKVVANHLYTEREVDALKRGGVQRLYMGNISSGKHEIVAFLSGQGPSKRDFRPGATLNFDKSAGPQVVELKINDNSAREQPEFTIKVWE